MNLTEPTTVLAPGLTIPLLRALASRGPGATAEQLRRAADAGTAAGVRRALDRLAEHGLLHEVRLGERATLYELNRDHILYPAVQALLAVSDALPRRLAEAISSWARMPLSAALFGSAARRDGGLHSDVDLLVVRPPGAAGHDGSEWGEQIHDLRGRVRRWTGNHLQVVDRTTDELAELARAGEAIVEEWRRDAVTVYGKDLRELLEETR